MSRDSWRFDPNRDYRDDYEDDYGSRGRRNGFQPIKKGKKFHKDKLDGKRRNRMDEDRW
jgi:hypothetical protein